MIGSSVLRRVWPREGLIVGDDKEFVAREEIVKMLDRSDYCKEFLLARIIIDLGWR